MISGKTIFFMFIDCEFVIICGMYGVIEGYCCMYVFEERIVILNLFVRFCKKLIFGVV